MPKVAHPARRARLAVRPLEARDVPAGTVTASLAGGVLTLSGDDFGNTVTIKVTPTEVTLTPDAATTIDSLADPAPPTPGTPVVLPGRAVALTATFRDGDDTVRIDPAPDFILPGVVYFDLGDGDNTLALEQDLLREQLLRIGTLVVRAGDGFDTVSVRGGLRGTAEDPGGPQFSHVRSAALSYGDGGSDTTLGGEGYLGVLPGGITITGGDGRDDVRLRDAYVLSNLAVAGGPGLLRVSGVGSGMGLSATGAEVEYDVGGGFGVATITGSSRAAVTLGEGTSFVQLTVQALRRDGVATVDVTGDPVQSNSVTPFGSLAVRSAGSASLTVRPGADLEVIGRIGVTAGLGDAEVRVDASQMELYGSLSVASTGGDARVVQSGASRVRLRLFDELGYRGSPPNLTLSAFQDAELDLSGGETDIVGAVSLSGRTAARLAQSGANTTTVGGPVRVAGGAAEAVLEVAGDTWVAKGTTTVTSPGRAVLDVAAATTGRLEGNVTVQGGSGFDEVTAGGTARFLRNLGVNLGGGGGRVDLGPGTTVGGALTVFGGTGADEVALRGVDVTGATRVVTGGGADLLTVDLGATFDGTFDADLGAGADIIDIAQTPGGLGPVTFTGKATILAGAGGDTLRLGRNDGDDTTRAVFGSAGSVIGGGPGVNLFDDEAADFTGPVSIANWTDPTP